MISINNSPQSLLANQQGTFSGTLTSVGGYAAPVNLSCTSGATNPPSTCTVSQPVTPIATGAPFTVMVSATTAGNYNFKVQAVGTDSLSTSHSAAAVLNVEADFQFSNNSGIQTVRAGTPAQYTLNFAPVGSPTFANAVTYSRSHLPALSSCTFSPPQIAAGSAPATVMFTVTTTAPVASLRLWDDRRETNFLYALWLSLPAFGIVFVGRGTQRSQSFRRIGQCAALAMVLAAAFLQVSCGGGGGARSNPKPGTPSGQYTVNIDARSGSASHSHSVTQKVQ